MSDLVETLERRGFVAQITDRAALARMLAERKVAVYAGFDPSAPTLHCGNLVPIMGLAQFQRAGHRPIVLIGGATGMVGDPSGKSDERNLLTADQVQANSACIAKQLSRFLDFEGDNAAVMVNNADWIGQFGYLEWLRDVGKHFSVNAMMAKESIRSRLEDREQGISYTEFSYMLLQAYDFLHLFREHDCPVQVGGNDQWGNITAGIDLIRRLTSQQAYGMTFPLLTTAGGEKFGKTAEGAVWLDAERTSVWDFYQYWVRTDDRDVIRNLYLFTFLPDDEIKALECQLADAPQDRAAPKALAREVTAIVHSPEQADAMAQGAGLLYKQELKNLTDEQLATLFADAPTHDVPRERLSAGIPIVELLAETRLVSSKSDARRRLKSGGIYVNNRPVDDGFIADESSLASPNAVVLRSGKKNYWVVQVV